MFIPSLVPLLMTDTLRLRRAADMPTYRTDVAESYLPWVFGRATITPIPLDFVGQEWLVADHPIVGIAKVLVAGKSTDGWQLIQRVDGTGQPISVLRLAQASVAGPLAVTVIGRQHPVTGALLSSPGDIVREIMRLANHIEPAGSWSGLDDHYGLVQLGLAFTSPQTLRAALASVIEPLYAMWRPGWAAPRAPDVPVAIIDVANAKTVSCRADTVNLATFCRVSYDYDWAANASRGTLLLGVPDAENHLGEILQDIDLPTIRTARDALKYASLRLADTSRTEWVVSADVDARIGALVAGQTITMDHSYAPTGPAVLTAVSYDREHGNYQIKAVMYSESAPTVEMRARNAALDQAGPTDPVVFYKDGNATFTVLDDQGNPLANATVQLDGLLTAVTDGTGRVQFKTSRGAHTLTVSASGFATFELDVVV